MTFNLPITKDRLREANKRIADSARKGEKLMIEWKMMAQISKQ